MIKTNLKSIVVIGAGGHAKVVISALRATGCDVAAVADDDRAKWGTSLLGAEVRGPISELHGYYRAVIAIGNNRVRETLAFQLQQFEWVTVVHPTAYVHPTARLGPGTVVFAGSVIQPDSTIGAHSIINTGATVDHDCSIGDFAHLAPGVHLAGGVSVAQGAFLGIGAVVIPGRSIGAWATVGAGAAVIHDVPGGATVVGVPAAEIMKKSRGESPGKLILLQQSKH